MSETVGVPAWLCQAEHLHALLVDQATWNEYNQLIWEGKLLNLYHETGASNGSYSRIIEFLVASELIRFVQRGNRHQSTIIEITEKLWPSEPMPPEHLTEARHSATVVAALERQVSSLKAWRESLEKGGLDIAEVLKDFEVRLTRIERELKKHGKSKA